MEMSVISPPLWTSTSSLQHLTLLSVCVSVTHIHTPTASVYQSLTHFQIPVKLCQHRQLSVAVSVTDKDDLNIVFFLLMVLQVEQVCLYIFYIYKSCVHFENLPSVDL